MKFLDGGISLMQNKQTREMLKREAQPGQKLIQIQRGGWDSLGVDQDIGCAELDQLEKSHPDDVALFQKRQEFVVTAQRTFLQALEDKRPKKLENKKPMPRDVIIQFFDACNTKMDLPEVRQTLLAEVTKTRQMPNGSIINLQRHLLEVMGFEKEHGCRLLSKIGKDFPNDTELHQRFNM